MPDAEHLPALIGQIYDAALDPALWAEALPDVARFIGGPSAALWSEDAVAKSANVTCFSGFDAGYVNAYLSDYANVDPSRVTLCLADVGECLARSRMICDGDFFRTTFYKDWARPQSLVDCLYLVLDRSATRTTMFAVSRHKHDGAIDEAMHRRMRAVGPHLRRASLICQTIDRESRLAANLSDAFDGLGTSIFFVDKRGHLVHANAAARNLVAEAAVLRVVSGRLVACDIECNRRFQDTLLAAGLGDIRIGTAGASLALRARDGEDYVARVLPLVTGSRSQIGKGAAAAAAVFVSKAELSAALPLEMMARRYRLTPMELRVVTVLVDAGGGISNVADVLDVSAETVKTHLANLYEKTGVRRQADLVKLALRFSTPSVG